MTVLLLALLVVVIAAWGLKKRMPRASPVIMGVAALVAILVGLYAVTIGRPASTQDLLGNAEATAGVQLAERIAADFPQGGTILVLEMPPLEGASKDVSHRRMEGLHKVLAKPPFRLVAAGPDQFGRGSSEKDFKLLRPDDVAGQVLTWCRESKDIVAVASLLMELPDLQNVSADGMPPWYGFDAGPSENYRKAQAKNLLKMGILYRGDFAVDAATKGDKQAFATIFRVLEPGKEKP